jgi:hypothetical protein
MNRRPRVPSVRKAARKAKPTRDQHHVRMHERSGVVRSADPLVAFLYVVLRDHIQPGTIENIMLNHVEYTTGQSVYSNGWLAAYAQDLASRLRSKSE